MRKDWESMFFTFIPYKETGVSILSAFDDIQVLLDDHIVKATTMKGSPFIAPFEHDINEWDLKLVRTISNIFVHLRNQFSCISVTPSTL